MSTNHPSRAGRVWWLHPGFLLLAGIALGALVLVVYRDVSEPPESDLIPQFPASSHLRVLEVLDGSWTVRDLDGTELKLAALRGKPVFINFWATWCGPCIAEMPSIEKLYDSMKDEGVAFVIVSDEREEIVRSFAASRHVNLPFYLFKGRVPRVLYSDEIPATFILNRQGEVVFKHVGMADWSTVDSQRFLRSLL